MQTKQVTAYVADEGYNLRTLFVKQFFTETIPADARLYVRRADGEDFYRVTGISQGKMTGDIFAETVNFEWIDLKPTDFLYVETKK